MSNRIDTDIGVWKVKGDLEEKPGSHFPFCEFGVAVATGAIWQQPTDQGSPHPRSSVDGAKSFL